MLVDKQLVYTWVKAPIKNIAVYALNPSTYDLYHNVINQMQHRLQAAIIGREVCVSWIHGDYSPANILVDPSGSQVTGIVDWDLARSNELPLFDLLHLLISIRMESQKREMGRIVSDLLIKRDWSPAELKLIQAVGQDLRGSSIELQDLLLLTWLRHVNANVMKTSRFDNHEQWAAENILSVLKVLENS